MFDDVRDKIEDAKNALEDVLMDTEHADVEARIDYPLRREPMLVIDLGLGGEHELELSEVIGDHDNDDIDRLIAWLEGAKT